MPIYYDKGDGRRVHRSVRRQPNDGVAPPNRKTRKLIQDAKEKNEKFTPQELRVALSQEGHNIPLDVIIGVLNGK